MDANQAYNGSTVFKNPVLSNSPSAILSISQTGLFLGSKSIVAIPWISSRQTTSRRKRRPLCFYDFFLGVRKPLPEVHAPLVSIGHVPILIPIIGKENGKHWSKVFSSKMLETLYSSINKWVHFYIIAL